MLFLMPFRRYAFQIAFRHVEVTEGVWRWKQGVKLDTPADIDKLSVPFIASTGAGFIFVTGISGNTLTYMTQGVSETMPLNEIVGDWDGTAFLADSSLSPAVRPSTVAPTDVK